MAPKAFYQLSVTVVPGAQEALSSFLFDLGAMGLVEQDEFLVSYFPETVDDADLCNSVARYAHELREMNDLDWEIELELHKIEQRDWNAEWKSRLKLLPISDRIVIKPTWVDLPENPPEIVIELDPEMAFGSGEHATSRMTLQLIEKNLVPGMRVLDIGVGTGILSIGALRLGAGKTIAFDIDPVAAETAKKNAKKNRVAEKFFPFTGELTALGKGEFDLVAANVNRSQIVKMLPDMVALVKKGGFCLLSGILDVEEKLIVDACKASGLNVSLALQEKEWLAFEARKE